MMPRTGVFMALGALLIIVLILSVALGSVSIPIKDILTILLGGQPERASWVTIVVQFRLPKALTAALAGAALGVGGLQMQTLFRNPLADPYVLGVSSGASLGVALVVLAAGSVGAKLLAGAGFLSDLGLAAAASLGAGLVLLGVLAVASRVRSSVTLLILGIMFGYAVGAAVSLLLYFSIPERIQAYLNWTFGSFGGITWTQMRIFAPVVMTGLALAGVLAKPLNALLLGEEYAQSMGIAVRKTRILIIFSTALLAGAVTAFCGPIGFLGIAVPHVCRAASGTSDHRLLLPACMIVGGIAALLADILTQMPGNQTVLPLNAIMALIGAPVVVWVILRGRRLQLGAGT
jgi:iron complex transport system permease protein